MSSTQRCDEPTCTAWAQVVVPHSEDNHSKPCEMHGQAFSHDEKVAIEEWNDGVRLGENGGRVQTDGGQSVDGIYLWRITLTSPSHLAGDSWLTTGHDEAEAHENEDCCEVSIVQIDSVGGGCDV